MEFAALAAVLAAMGGVLKLVFDHLQKKDEQFTTALTAQQERQEKFLTNHMSSITNTLENLTSATEGVADRLDILHEDNRETAVQLKAADEVIIRLVSDKGHQDEEE